MGFLRSRLVLVGLLVAWPLAEIAGCSPKERVFGPAGEGGASAASGKGGRAGGGAAGVAASGGMAGDQSGGAAGVGEGGVDSGGTGARGGTGGSGTGGSKGGSGGSSNGGSGGSSNGGSGGSSNGGSGGGGKGGSGATGGTDMSAGQGGMPPECVPTGTTEVCSDGVDNNCDGVTDCLVLRSQFPAINGAASGSDVAYTFETPSSNAKFECRYAHGTTPGGTFAACARVAASTVYPFSDTMASNAANDGLWTTQVRLKFPDGSASAPFERTVYIHSSLHGVTRCPFTASDDDYITAAKPYLEDSGAFDTATIRQPFVQIAFTPPMDGTFSVGAGDGTVRWESLRRRFGFSTDRHYMVMTRAYTSRNTAGMGCLAAVKRVHLKPGSWVFSGTMEYQKCTALVFNTKGAGYCLGYSGSAVTSAEHIRNDYSAQVPAPRYSPKADNFAWRKLGAHDIIKWPTNFSPKCDTAGCQATDTSGYTLFLPDKAFFPYW